MQRRSAAQSAASLLLHRTIAIAICSELYFSRKHCKFCTNWSKFETERFRVGGVCRSSAMAVMTSLASSCSAFLEGCDALRVRGATESPVQRREMGVAVRCDVRRSDVERSEASVIVSRRQAACAFIAGALVFPVAPMARALLEADDDDSLLEKVKEDKKKRIQKRSTAINDFVKESGFVQVAVYKLSEAGQAIDGGDYSKATAVLAQQNADWIRDMQAALSTVSSNADEEAAADSFRSALTSLQAAVKSGDSISSRTAFIASAEALDKWTRLTGLSEKVVGL